MFVSKVWNLLNDLSKKSGITEISLNGPKNVFVEKDGRFIQINANFQMDEISSFIEEVAKLNNRPCDSLNPILDGILPDGSRINIINGPFVFGGPAISIRKYSKQIINFEQNKNIFGCNDPLIELIRAMILGKLNIVVSGGTGVGKTTLLNLLISEIPKHERLITIEDTLELSINMPNVVRLESGDKQITSSIKLTTRDLVKNTLRMRPDRIVIGESRGGEIFDLLQAMNTGHEGSMTSIHANSAGECLSRMETLFLMSGFDLPINVVRKQISSAINFIFHLTRDSEGKRVISEIIEVCGMEGNVILTQKILERDDEGYIKFNGIAPKSFEKLHRLGGLPINFFDKVRT